MSSSKLVKKEPHFTLETGQISSSILGTSACCRDQTFGVGLYQTLATQITYWDTVISPIVKRILIRIQSRKWLARYVNELKNDGNVARLVTVLSHFVLRRYCTCCCSRLVWYSLQPSLNNVLLKLCQQDMREQNNTPKSNKCPSKVSQVVEWKLLLRCYLPCLQ